SPSSTSHGQESSSPSRSATRRRGGGQGGVAPPWHGRHDAYNRGGRSARRAADNRPPFGRFIAPALCGYFRGGPMLRRTRQLLEMIRFSHTLFALPFALLAAALA